MVTQARGKGQGYLGQGLGMADFLAALDGVRPPALLRGEVA